MLLREGSKSEYVVALQEFLVTQGMLDEDGVDGDYGEMTREAVEMYQAAMELTEDGIAGKDTLTAMGIDWAEHEEGDEIQDVEANNDQLEEDDYQVVVDAFLSLISSKAREDAEDTLITGINLISPYAEDLHLDTPIAWALFLGQIRQEVGRNFTDKENLNYSCAALPKLFSAYRGNSLAAQHGRGNGHRADQKAIADQAYGGRKELGNCGIDTGDGSLFMGAGLKQLTGRANYQKYHDWLEENLNDVYQEQEGDKIMTLGAELVSRSPHNFLSAVYFWYDNQLYKGVEMGLTRKASDYVTKKVNRYTKSYGDRWKHTMEIAKEMGIA